VTTGTQQAAPWISDEEIRDAVESTRTRGVAVALRVKDGEDLPPGDEFYKLTTAIDAYVKNSAQMADEYYDRVQRAFASVHPDGDKVKLPLGMRVATLGALAAFCDEDTGGFFGGDGLVPLGLPDGGVVTQALLSRLGEPSQIKERAQAIGDLLNKHASCDWGECDPEDRKVNEDAVKTEQRVMGVHTVGGGEKVWVITEWDRSVTTILLPNEY